LAGIPNPSHAAQFYRNPNRRVRALELRATLIQSVGSR
jgi:hypothetical protein